VEFYNALLELRLAEIEARNDGDDDDDGDDD